MIGSQDLRNPGLRLIPAALLILVLALGACTNDQPQGDNGEVGDQAAAIKEYCGNVLTIETAPQPEIDFGILTPEQQAEEFKKYATSTLRPIADKLTGSAPEEIKDEAQVFSGALAEVETSGNFEGAYNKPDVVDAFNTLHAYDLKNCGWKQVDVVATNYLFTGVPATLTAGATSFEFDNKGTEQHEMVIFRKADGETLTFDQILAIKDEAEVDKHMKLVTATEAAPGQDDRYAVADVKAGDYIMVCFVPVGSTPEAAKAAREAGKEIEGAPHFTQGMKAEFKVS